MNIGLALFVAVTVLNGAGLILDLVLYLTGLPTISAYARSHEWAVVSLLGLQMISVAGLAYHLSLAGGE